MFRTLINSGLLLVLAAAACGGSDGTVSSAPPPADPLNEAGGGGGGDAGIDGQADAGVPPCADGESVCTAFDKRRVCKTEAGSVRWVDETCAAGSGCLRGACVAARCSDECTLGTTNGARSCESWDVEKATWTPGTPASSLHDRSREYLRWLQKDHLPFGGLADTHFTDPPTFAVADRYDTGDSALWTGTYLATEAWRLLATGSVDAREHVRALVKTLHLWMNVSPSPGVLARFVRPAGQNSPPNGIDCTKNTHHCNVMFEGKAYDYNGHVSRDQYQGVMLGYALAYEALGSGDEAERALIRNDVLALIDELMKEKEVDAKISYQGTDIPAKIKTRFMLVVDEELDNGKIVLSYNGGNEGGWRGFQEFIPNIADIFKQVPIIGLVAPAVIPRDGSAIMLASFFRIALRVTEGLPAFATKRAAIESFYLTNSTSGGNVHDWLEIAKTWTRGGDDCGAQYYGNNIALQPLYNWARLEKDPAIKTSAVDIVTNKAWPAFLTHKNTFFTFLTGANMASPDTSVLADAKTQLAQFPTNRVIRPAVDLRSDARFMPHQASCESANNAAAIDVSERVKEGFIWQRDPWALFDSGDPAMVYTGGDYLSAYWLGRRHDFIADDAAPRCLRWK